MFIGVLLRPACVSVRDSDFLRATKVVTPSMPGSWSAGTTSGPGPGPLPAERLRIGGGAGGVEGDVAFHLLHDLVDVAVQHRDRAEAAQTATAICSPSPVPQPQGS